MARPNLLQPINQRVEDHWHELEWPEVFGLRGEVETAPLALQTDATGALLSPTVRFDERGIEKISHSNHFARLLHGSDRLRETLQFKIRIIGMIISPDAEEQCC